MKKAIILLTLISIMGGSIIGCGPKNDKISSNNVKADYKAEDTVEDERTDAEITDKAVSNDDKVEIIDETIKDTNENEKRKK